VIEQGHEPIAGQALPELVPELVPLWQAFGIAPVFRTLSIGGKMISEVLNGKEALQRRIQA
jgi:hypothetical protein